MNPIDLLPVTRPFDDPTPPDENYFYQNVVKNILPDIMNMEATGIPINLDKVKEIETITDNELLKVRQKLINNPIIKDFIEYKTNTYKKNNLVINKTIEDFKKEYVSCSVQIRTFIVNEYLKDHGLEKDQLDKWTIKDLKKYANMTANLFLTSLATNRLNTDARAKIEMYMNRLAEEKLRIYELSKQEQVELKSKQIEFNPNSSLQKVELFRFLGIESESQTKGGQDQWNRDNLEKLQKKLALELEENSDE